MKKLFVILLSLFLLLCSCDNATPDVSETETEPAVTADTDLLLSAAGFETVYDENLGATWVYRPEVASGLFARILVYNDGQTSFRVICTEAPSLDMGDLAGIPVFEYGNCIYAVRNGDEAVNDALMSALQGIANGGDCKVGDREITDEERECLSKTIALYKAAYGEPYSVETSEKSTDTERDGSGYRVYECDGYSIKYPNSFTASEEDGVLILTSGIKKPRTVSVKHTDTVFSPVITEEEAVSETLTDLGAELVSDVKKTTVGGQAAYTFSCKKDDMYLTLYYVDGGKGVYVITSGSYDKNDSSTDSIISTFKIK